jgi:glucose-1-phosphate thymidylyltransferase
MNIAKAVVLVADCRGPEPWPSLGLPTRHLAPVANKPVLFHHLEALAGAGIQDAAIVTDETTSPSLREAVGDGAAWGLDVRYIEREPSGGILALRELADFVGQDPIVVQHGDVLLRERLTVLGEQFAQNQLDALVVHAGHWSRTSARQGLPSIDSYLMGSGVYPMLRHDAVGARGARLDDALARLRVGGARVEEREVEACLPCRGGTVALLEANRRILEEMRDEPLSERVFRTEIQGRLALDPSAEVRDSLIRGPVAIGPGASISNAYIGPYTSIGAGVKIDSVEIEHSIVLDGARICFIGARIEGSLVGPDAQIERDFRVPQAVRLSVGARAEVALS